MVEKVISLYKCDFTKEQWKIICDEFHKAYKSLLSVDWM